MKIAEPTPGTFRGELDNLTGPWLGQPLLVIWQQPQVTLEVASGAGMFEGKLNGPGTSMLGEWREGGRRTPARFERADRAIR